jgi:CheY-like chemotaxis protein
MVKALVVDDDRDFLKIVSKVLESAGYAVITSPDAHDAMEKIEQETFDIVLSDANMPGASGFDLVKTMRNNPRYADTAIALLTGRRDRKDIDRGLSCGADDYFVKPIDPDLFLAKVKSLLSKKPQREVLEISFAESMLRIDAHLETAFKIIKISEIGMTVWGPLTIAANHKFKMQSPLFSTIGVEPPMLRSLQCELDPKVNGHYFCNVSFVGLRDSELQKIRFWLNTHATKRKVS